MLQVIIRYGILKFRTKKHRISEMWVFLNLVRGNLWLGLPSFYMVVFFFEKAIVL